MPEHVGDFTVKGTLKGEKGTLKLFWGGGILYVLVCGYLLLLKACNDGVLCLIVFKTIFVKKDKV